MEPRRLVLVRHAEAASGPVDADRPLTGRGARRAAAIGSWLQQAGAVPDRAVVSTARRAVSTWERAAGSLPHLRPILDARVYDNTVEALLEVIREAPVDVQVLAVVGHNPSIGELSLDLDDGRGDPAARGRVEAGFPTGGVAVFQLSTPFDLIAPGAARLDAFAVPGD